MKEYKVLIGELVGENNDSLGKEGDVVALDETSEFVKVCLENNVIEEVVAVPEGATVVMEEAKADVLDETPAETAAAPSAENVAPNKYYRGSLIISEEPRTVGAQTFQHIKTGEGRDYDLTEDEYKKDVTISK